MAGKTIRRFWDDRRGNYIIVTAVTMVPLCGAIGLAVDYAEMSRQRQVTLNALDAAGIATARRLVAGATDQQAKDYAQDFFDSNIGAIKSSVTTLAVTLPNSGTGGGTLKLVAQLNYKPYFLSTFRYLIKDANASSTIPFRAETEIRLKNTLEVALVLDNSGSMKELGNGSGKQRMELVKTAAKELVTTLAAQGTMMKQVAEPVRIGVVPFAASVNVGVDNDDKAWMDTTGISPVHHENFDWSSLGNAAQLSGNVWYARGSGWDSYGLKDKPLTRFALFDKMKRVSKKAAKSGSKCPSGTVQNGDTCFTFDAATAWAGCVESRPYPLNVNDTTPSTGNPASLFVPMFAPDETDTNDSYGRPANNNWWNDEMDGKNFGGGVGLGVNQSRQEYMGKYFSTGTDVMPFYSGGEGPNASCTTNAITPIRDVTVDAGKTAINAAIDAMEPDGATNVPEGLAWGWRVVSGGEPFSEGRPDSEKGNDKVVIVLTDGANTYYTPGSVYAEAYSGLNFSYGGNDLAGNKAIYSAYGYAGINTPGYTLPRLFQGTSNAVSKSDYSNANYSKAMNEQFAALCANAKAGNITLMTVAVDLNSLDASEKAQIDALSACASESRFRKNPDGKQAKMFWNSTGASLSKDFKEIANELSNLRIVS